MFWNAYFYATAVTLTFLINLCSPHSLPVPQIARKFTHNSFGYPDNKHTDGKTLPRHTVLVRTNGEQTDSDAGFHREVLDTDGQPALANFEVDVDGVCRYEPTRRTFQTDFRPRTGHHRSLHGTGHTGLRSNQSINQPINLFNSDHQGP